MKGYFANPEIKLSSAAITAVILLFLSVTVIIQKYNYDVLKDNYTKTMGAVALRVIDKDPALEKEIISAITRDVTKEEALKGKTLMEEYGLNESTENTVFPYIKDVQARFNYVIAVIFIFLVIILLILNYLQLTVFYNKIRKVTDAAKKVVDGNYDTAISENREGDFAKLSSSFNSMREVIRNNISELNKEKEFLADLLSDISHQLKTPLSSMILYNDLMLAKDLSKEQRDKFLENNRNQLYKMNWLIKQLLKLAKLDASAIELNRENESLNETVLEGIEAISDRAQENNISIDFHAERPVYFVHDRLWLEEALSNIIKNAVEHTKAGGKINIELTENPIYRRIIIEDNGEGISEEELPNIFKRFYKIKNTRKTESIGIGLALAKSIIEAHGGIIEAASKIGVGTRFIITFLKY